MTHNNNYYYCYYYNDAVILLSYSVDDQYSRSTVLGKIGIERMAQAEFGSLQLEDVTTVYPFEVPPAATVGKHFVAWPHHLFMY